MKILEGGFNYESRGIVTIFVAIDYKAKIMKRYGRSRKLLRLLNQDASRHDVWDYEH